MGADNAVITMARLKADPAGVRFQLQSGDSFVITKYGRFLAAVQIVYGEFQAGVVAATMAAKGLTIDPIRNTFHAYWDDFMSNAEGDLTMLHEQHRIGLIHDGEEWDKIVVLLPFADNAEATLVAKAFNAGGFTLDSRIEQGVSVDQLMAEANEH